MVCETVGGCSFSHFSPFLIYFSACNGDEYGNETNFLLLHNEKYNAIRSRIYVGANLLINMLLKLMMSHLFMFALALTLSQLRHPPTPTNEVFHSSACGFAVCIVSRLNLTIVSLANYLSH